MLNFFYVVHFSLIFNMSARNIPIVSMYMYCPSEWKTVNPYQLASLEASGFGSTLFSKKVKKLGSAGLGLITILVLVIHRFR